jgi:hypothetical protein
MTIQTHAAVDTPSVPHDWMVLLVILVQVVHHARRLRHDAAGWVATRRVLWFAGLHEVWDPGPQPTVVRVV